MSNFKNKFKRFGGDYIPDIIEYLKSYIEIDPTITLTVGCDSIQRRRKTVYAITIMLYNTDLKHGAHVVFFRESYNKIKDNNERLYKEAQYLHDIATYLDNELSSFYNRKDLTEYERRRYKFHLAKCSGEFADVSIHNVPSVMSRLPLTDDNYRLVDIHIDFNPFPGSLNEKGVIRNKSYSAYKNYVPWLRALNFRVWCKPDSPASSTAADLLLQD